MSDPLHAFSHGALVVHRSDLSSLVVSGPDRASWLNALLTCDVSKISPGRVAAGLALDKQGRVLSEVLVSAAEDRIFVAVDAARRESLLAHFDRYLIMEDAEIVVAPDPMSWMVAYGPKAATLPDASASFRHFGFPATLLTSPESSRAALLDRLGSSGAEVVIATLEDFDRIRLDLGIQRFGIEFGESTYAEEAGLDQHAIDFNKGCYLGQEVVVKMRSRGKPPRKLVRLVLQGADPVADGAEVASEAGELVGSVRSCHSSALLPDHVVAFAIVRSAVAASPSLRCGDRVARVVEASGLLQ